MTTRRTLKLTRIPMEVRAQNTWKETIEKESMARLMFVKHELLEEDIWFDRTKYRPRGQPIILTSPTLLPELISNSETLQEKTEEIGNILYFVINKYYNKINNLTQYFFIIIKFEII